MIALLWYNARAYVYLRCLRMRLMYSVTLKQGVQGDAVLLPGSGVSPDPLPPSGRRRRYASNTEELLYSQSILQHRQDTID